MRGKKANSLHKKSGASVSVPQNAPKSNQTQPALSKSTPPKDRKPAKESSIGLTITDTEAEIRRDYIYDEYVIIAPKRHNRPFDFRGNDHPLIETASSPHLDEQGLIDELKSPLGGWPVRVVKNKFPAITLDNVKAYGQQEIVVDTPLSNMPPGKLSLESTEDVLMMFQKRLSALKRVPHIQYVQIFKNDGHHAGASLAHAHTQIFALPIVPPHLQEKARVADTYASKQHSHPFDDIIAYELKQKQRVIFDSDELLCIAPYASQWSLETWIIPKRQIMSFEELNKKEIKSFADTLLKLLHKLNKFGINYNYFIENALSPNQRCVMKIYGRNVVSPLGGLEVSTGVMINTISPEDAARWYKN